MAKLTREEYDAQAMLLGMRFNVATRCFVPITEHRHLRYGPEAVWLDADTLEPVYYYERAKRRDEYTKIHTTIEG